MEDTRTLRERIIRDTKAGLILDAAREVFAQKGYHEARLEDIAVAAGFSKASIYNYYKDKEEIFLCLATKDFDGLQEALAATINPEATVIDNIEKGLRIVFSFFGKNFAFFLATMNFRCMQHLMPEQLADQHEELIAQFREKYEAIIRIYEKLFASARAAGKFDSPLSDKVLASYLASLVRGAMVQWKIMGRMGDVDREIACILEFVAHGIGIKKDESCCNGSAEKAVRMKKTVAVLAAVACLLMTMGTQAGTYTLDQLLSEGYKNSKALKAVEKDMAKADAQIKEAIGSAFPTIDASANYQHAFSQYSPFSGGSMSPADQQQTMTTLMNAYSDSALAPYQYAFKLTPEELSTIQRTGPAITSVTLQQIFSNLDFSSFVKDNTIALSLSAKQALFAQGKVMTGLKIARLYKATLENKYTEEKQKLTAGITKLFYAALLAQNNRAIQSEAVALARETHRLTIARYAVGKGSELDTLGSRLHYENAIVDEQKALSSLKMAYEALIVQAGIVENASTFSIEGEFPPADFTVSLDDAVGAMKSANPQLRQLEKTEQIQKELVTLAKSDFYPLIFCGGSIGKIYQYNTLDDIEWGDRMYDDRKVFVGMTLNLFNGLKTPQKVRQAEADRFKFVIVKKQAEEGLELAVKNAYEQYELSRAVSYTHLTLPTIYSV